MESDAPAVRMRVGRVRVQIVLYQSVRHLRKLVRGLEKLEPPDGGMSVHFLNNSPGDASRHMLDDLAPGFVYTYTEADNVGFGAGHNLLSAAALDADYLWLLNPDTIPFFDCARALVAAAEARPRAALIEAAQFPVEHPKAYDADGCTNWCSGAALMVRSASWKELGGFDRQLFLYGEDVDLSWRAWLGGWECIYVPSARVCHVTEDQDSGKRPAVATRGIRLAELWLRARYFDDGEVADFATRLRSMMPESDATSMIGEFERICPQPIRASHPRITLADEPGRYATFRW